PQRHRADINEHSAIQKSPACKSLEIPLVRTSPTIPFPFVFFLGVSVALLHLNKNTECVDLAINALRESRPFLSTNLIEARPYHALYHDLFVSHPARTNPDRSGFVL